MSQALTLTQAKPGCESLGALGFSCNPLLNPQTLKTLCVLAACHWCVAAGRCHLTLCCAAAGGPAQGAPALSGGPGAPVSSWPHSGASPGASA